MQTSTAETSPGTTPPAPPPRWCWFLPPLAALGVRLAFLPLAAVLPPLGDSTHYVSLAKHFVREGVFQVLDFGVRPPLFPWLVMLGLDGNRDIWPGVFLLQIACDVLACILLMRLTARLFGGRAGLASGWIHALYPTAILYSATIVMAESAALLMSVLALTLLVRIDEALEGPAARCWRLAGLLGFVLGIGILTKELLLPTAITMGVCLLLRRGAPLPRRFGVAALAAVVALAVTSPWIAYNAKRHDLLIITGTAGDLGLIIDNHPPDNVREGYFKGGVMWENRRTLKSKVELAREVFWAALTEWPLTTAKRAWTRLRVAFGPELITATQIAYEFGEISPGKTVGFTFFVENWRLPPGGWGRFVQIVAGLAGILVFGAAAAGMVLSSGGILRGQALLLTGLFLVTFALTSSDSRYRLILLPYYLPFASLAIVRLFGRSGAGDEAPDPASRSRAERTGLLVAILLLLTIFVLPAPIVV